MHLQKYISGHSLRKRKYKAELIDLDKNVKSVSCIICPTSSLHFFNEKKSSLRMKVFILNRSIEVEKPCSKSKLVAKKIEM